MIKIEEEYDGEPEEFYINEFKVKKFGQYSGGQYAKRNEKIVKFLEKFYHPNMAIVEIAAAEGDLAERILLKYPTMLYMATDFCRDALDYMCYRLRKFPGVSVQRLDGNKDFHILKNATNHGYNTFISTSLEHIKNDLKLLSVLPRGELVILTFPNFMTPGHVRCFKSMAEVRKRYCDLLRIIFWVELPAHHWANYIKRFLIRLHLLTLIRRCLHIFKKDPTVRFLVFARRK